MTRFERCCVARARMTLERRLSNLVAATSARCSLLLPARIPPGVLPNRHIRVAESPHDEISIIGQSFSGLGFLKRSICLASPARQNLSIKSKTERIAMKHFTTLVKNFLVSEDGPTAV